MVEATERLLSWIWANAVELVCDVAGDVVDRRLSQRCDAELARWDDVHDAWVDDDGMDATGL